MECCIRRYKCGDQVLSESGRAIKQCGDDTEKFKTVQQVLVNSAQECVPNCGVIAKKKWMTSEILDQMEFRHRLKKDTNEYRWVNMRIQNMCWAATEECLHQQFEEIEQLENQNAQIMHEKVNAVVNKRKWYISSWLHKRWRLQCANGTGPC